MENSSIVEPKSVELQPCPICGRTFRPDALERHQNVCKKTSTKKRKVFDSSKQRSTGVIPPDAPPPKQTAEKTGTQKSKRSTRTSPKPKATVKTPGRTDTQNPKPVQKSNAKSNWREKHDELIRTIRASRDIDKKNGNDDESEAKSRIPSDYVKCSGCDRHFNQRAAERHIPWCEKKKAQTPKATISEGAKEKLAARVKYKVPPPNQTKKPKTAGHTSISTKKTPKSREQAPYSSPPSFLESRNERSNSRSMADSNGNYSKSREGQQMRLKRENIILPYKNPDSKAHAIKFKERFPNHINKSIDFEESFSTEQLKELLSSTKLTDSRGPKTVPGVRCLGGRYRAKSQNDLTTSSRSTDTSCSADSTASSSSGGSSKSWNKRYDLSFLPEVSSSELPNYWMGNHGWTGELDSSFTSSGSSTSSGSLPPLSRDSPSEPPLVFYCHQCNSKFPLIGAKYCCECGAKRRNAGQTNSSQTG